MVLEIQIKALLILKFQSQTFMVYQNQIHRHGSLNINQDSQS